MLEDSAHDMVLKVYIFCTQTANFFMIEWGKKKKKKMNGFLNILSDHAPHENCIFICF